MEAEMAALAGSAATTLVGLLISETWNQGRDGIARLFARGRGTENVLAELEDSRHELITAGEDGDEATQADVIAEWRSRSRRLLRSDPAAADELRQLLESLGHPPSPSPSSSVHNVVSGGNQYGPVVQGGRISGVTLSFGAASPRDET